MSLKDFANLRSYETTETSTMIMMDGVMAKKYSWW